MIGSTLVRLAQAGLISLAGLVWLAKDNGNLLAGALVALGLVWGTMLLFILSYYLLVYGLSGLLDDIEANRRRDRW